MADPSPRTEFAPPRPGIFAAPAGAPPHIQIASGYLVVETPGGFEVIDPHALHERILFEQMRVRVLGGAVEVQSLLLPAVVELTALEEARLEELRPALAEVGLVVEPFGRRAAAVQAFPALLTRVRDWAPVLRDLLGAADEARGGAREARAKLAEHLVATMACKAAVKLGERLKPAEVQALLEKRAVAERSHLCPHGRPTALAFPAEALERQFKR